MENIESGIFCPSCKMKNEPGATVCMYCNTPLDTGRDKTVILQKNETAILTDNSLEDILGAPSPSRERFMDFELPSKGIALINIDNGGPIAVQEEKIFLLGRVSPETENTEETLVDLTPYGGVELGISRLHAMIRQTKDGYQITDLGSSNGTWLENQRLVPKKVYPLNSGDRIRMGRLNLLVYYPSVSNTKK